MALCRYFFFYFQTSEHVTVDNSDVFVEVKVAFSDVVNYCAADSFNVSRVFHFRTSNSHFASEVEFASVCITTEHCYVHDVHCPNYFFFVYWVEVVDVNAYVASRVSADEFVDFNAFHIAQFSRSCRRYMVQPLQKVTSPHSSQHMRM